MLEPNARYQVVKSGAFLQCWLNCCLIQKPLNVGDVVTYQGEQMGLGSDNINRPIFVVDNFRGEFQPNFWGSVDPTYLSQEKANEPAQ
jgi:hypothetical protein